MRTRQLGAEALPLLPQSRATDPPEVARALNDAYALWSRAKRSEAFAALRTAIVKSAESKDAARANELAAAVKDFMAAVQGMPRPEAVPVPKGKPPGPPPRGRARRTVPPVAEDAISVDELQEPAEETSNVGPAIEPEPPPSRRKDSGLQRSVKERDPATPSSDRPALRGEEHPTTQNDLDEAWGAEASQPDEAAVPSPAVAPTAEAPKEPAKEEPAKEEPPTEEPAPSTARPTTLDSLDHIEALADVPDDAKAMLLAQARAGTLEGATRQPAPHMLIVLEGQIDVGVPGRDCAAAVVCENEVRILAPAPPACDALIICARTETARYLALDEEAARSLRIAAPWVVHELEAERDGILAAAGALSGRLGARIGIDTDLFDELRAAGEVRRLAGGTLVIKGGERVRAMVIVCAGTLCTDDGEEIVGGEILFPSELIATSDAPATVRTGSEGALLLVARRPATKALIAKSDIQSLLRGMIDS